MSKISFTGDQVDRIIGSGNADIITGSNGADYIDGRAGGDLIIGRRGDDVLTGGSGPHTPDKFGFNLGDGHDVVTDFSTAAHDALTFSYGNCSDASAMTGNLHDGWTVTTDEGHTLTVTQHGADALLTWENGDTVTLQHVDVAQMSASDLSFCSTSVGWMF